MIEWTGNIIQVGPCHIMFISVDCIDREKSCFPSHIVDMPTELVDLTPAQKPEHVRAVLSANWQATLTHTSCSFITKRVQFAETKTDF